MTPKQEEQLLCDYFKPDDTIKVNCRWLQAKLQELETLKADSKSKQQNAELRLALFGNRIASLESQLPTYELDVKA